MVKKLLIFLIAISAGKHVDAALSGIYTINGSIAASSSNYQTFESAVSDLKSGVRTDGGPANGPAISSAVTFDVANGTYTLTSTLVITSITGSSSSNTITFKSASGIATAVIIQYTSPSVALDAVIRIKGADNITFHKMTIINNSIVNGYSKGFHIDTAGTISNTSDSIVIRGCILRSAWWVSNTCSVINSVNNNKNLKIIGNDIARTYGVTFQGTSSILPYTSGLQIDSNRFDIVTSDAFKPIYIRYADAPLIRYNSINKNGCCADVHMDIAFVKGQMVIAYNRTTGTSGSNGILLDNINPLVTDVIKAKVYNNMLALGSTNIYGIKVNNSRYIDVFHNSINLYNTASTSSKGIEVYNSSALGTKVSVSNNIFYSINGHAIYLWGSSLALARQIIDTLDYNVYFNNSVVPFAYLQGTNFYSLSSLKSAVYSTGGGNDANSYFRNPQYISNTDLHVAANNCFLGRIGMVGIDYDGNTRPTKCMMGCDEPVRVSNNIGVDQILAPAAPFTTGSQNIKYVAMNYGSNNVTSFNAGYNVNGGSLQTKAITTNLNACDTVHVLFNGAQQYNFGGGYQILKCFTNSPNATPDAVLSNDTSYLAVCQPLSGLYTINPLGSGSTNFISFSLAAQSLSSCGVSGPVTFNISTGTYNEQFTFAPISGSSATNYILFKSASGVASDVNLTYNSTLSAANYTVRFLGASYIKFKNFTISATNNNFGTAINAVSGASYDSFFNLTINGLTTTSNSSNLSLFYSGSGVNNFIFFGSCRFNNGSYGIYMLSNGSAPSSENFTVSKCILSNQYFYGISAQNLAGVRLIDNTITTNSTSSNYTGIYAYWILIPADVNKPLITGNRIYGAIGGNGLFTNYVGVNSTVTSARRPLIANNMIQIGNGNFATFGLHDSYGNNLDFVHNSVNVGSTQTANTSAAGFFESAAYGGCTVQNNVFANYGGGASIRVTNFTYYPTTNYNNHYTTGANVAYLGAVGYASLAAWQGATAKDLNSIGTIPVFVSNTDLHSNAAAMNNVGVVSALATVDYDLQSRCPNGGCPGGTSNPDIGADEFQPIALDALVASIDNPLIVCPGSGSSNVTVTIKNMGTTTLTSDTIKWSVNGVMQTPYYWTGSLTQGITQSGITIGTFSFVTANSVVRAWTCSPNAGTDGNHSNDTATFTPGNLLSGTYTIGGTSPNFNTFTDAVNVLNAAGICGPVVFNVRQGTYNEKIQINAVTGSSVTNYITFKSDPANTLPVILTAGGNSTTTDNHTIFLNSTKYIAFRNITIVNTSVGTGAYGSVIRFAGLQDSIVFAKNIITGPSTTNTSINFAVFNSPNTALATDLLHRLVIDSNTISNGSYGIYMAGNSVAGNFESKTRIRNNVITGCYSRGVDINYNRNLELLRNAISCNLTYASATAVYLGFCDSFRVERNSINNFGNYGLYLSNANNQNGTGTCYSTIINNMIGGNSGGNPSGIYINPGNNRYLNIYHNSVSVSGSSYAFFMQQTALGHYNTIDIRNNSFANFGSNYAAYFYFSVAIPNLTINYNNYYSGGTMQIVGTSAYGVATGGSPTYNANSKGGNPGYINNLTNLHSINSQLTDCGTNLSAVTEDIDGNGRPMAPSITVDIGADEFNVPQYNIGVTAVTAPGCPLVAGLQDITVTIKNFGLATITSANVKYKVGVAGAVKTVAWTGSMATNATASVTFTGANQFNFTKLQIDSIITWTESPNGFSDSFIYNDTSIKINYLVLNGSYTVGGATPNFTNFTQVADALNCEGISGPVIFKVRNGTYMEGISLGVISGSSATNTITFTSETGIAANVIWQAPVGYTYTVKLTNTKHIFFRNMTVRNLNSPGNSFMLGSSGTDSCFNVIIQRCSMNNAWTGGATTASINATGRTHGLKILKNSISWSFGVSVIGNNSSLSQYNRGLVIDSNSYNTTFGDVFTPLNIQYANTPLIRYNTVVRSAGGGALTGDIRNITGPMDISYNKIHGSGVYGVKISAVNINGEINPALVYNNFFADNNTSASCYALDIENSNYVNVLNNSLYQNSNNANTFALRTYANATYGNVRIVNNNIVSNTSTTSSVPMSINGTTLANAKAMITECNYNNYYVVGGVGTTLLNLFGTNYTTVAAVRGTVYTVPSNNDLNSINVNPVYSNANGNDLHISNTSPVMGMGTSTSIFSNDIDGNPRFAPNFDIGADEIVRSRVRSVLGDYNSPSCVSLSGSAWIDLLDTSGNIVFSINPNGNNLGSTCWGVRILNSTDGITRTTSMPTSPNGLGYWLDRNGYITPTNQPTTPVSIKFYALNTELADIRSYAAAGSVNSETDSLKFFKDSMIITKYDGPVINLIPDDALQSSYVLGVPFTSVTGYLTNAVYALYNVNSFSEFTPTFFPSSTMIPLPLTNIQLVARIEGDNVVVKWKANDISNVRSFTIERYLESGQSSEIATIAVPVSVGPGTYSFTDLGIGLKNIHEATYRIKAITSSKPVFSNTSKVFFTNVAGVSVYPNPTENMLDVKFKSQLSPESKPELYVTDMIGKRYEINYLKKAADLYSINLGNEMAPGVYLLHISISEHVNYTIKLVKE